MVSTRPAGGVLSEQNSPVSPQSHSQSASPVKRHDSLVKALSAGLKRNDSGSSSFEIAALMVQRSDSYSGRLQVAMTALSSTLTAVPVTEAVAQLSKDVDGFQHALTHEFPIVFMTSVSNSMLQLATVRTYWHVLRNGSASCTVHGTMPQTCCLRCTVQTCRF